MSFKKQKKVAIVSLDARLGNELMGATRYRFLAEMLANNGYMVDFITSSFQHWEHAQRNKSVFSPETNLYKVFFIDEPGYTKDISLQRIYSHEIASKNLALFFRENHDYDLIYCQIPPNNVALSAARSAEKYKIPLVVDINDLWPEAFRVVVDIPLLTSIGFWPFYQDAKQVYQKASAIVGTSEEYASRGFKNRTRDIPKLVTYVGNEIALFDKGVQIYSNVIKKPVNEFWITYAGSIGDCYDLDTLVHSVTKVQKRYPNIVLKLLGAGPKENSLRKLASVLSARVDFEGYKQYQEMAAYLAKSDIVVNSLTKRSAQSIVGKIGDYLAAGKPMINTSNSLEFCKKVDIDGFGLNVEAENIDKLVDSIEKLYSNNELRIYMGENARKIAENQFDRPRSYSKIVKLINSLTDM